MNILTLTESHSTDNTNPVSQICIQTVFNKDVFKLFHSPTEDHNEVHDVPPVPEVGAFMEHKAQGDDLYTRLEAEHPYEIGLCLLLLMQSKSHKIRLLLE